MSCTTGANLLDNKASHMNLLRAARSPSMWLLHKVLLLGDSGPYKCLPCVLLLAHV